MKISYNWLKWYVPTIPAAEKLSDIFTYHLCEVESLDKLGTGEKEDWIFDLNILPHRAHDLLCHQGVARELAGQLGIEFKDPSPMYKVPESKPTNLRIQADDARRYMGRIVRNIKVGPSPQWVVDHLASIGQRSINNVVDAANITMFDCGQPIHCFDLDKIQGNIVVRKAHDGEQMTTLDNKELVLKGSEVLQDSDLVIADDIGALALAGIKGGKRAEVDENTKNILIEVANFFPHMVRKTSRRLGLLTDAAKRFENSLSPELCPFAMKEISGLFVEYGWTDFEDIVDVYVHEGFKKPHMLGFSASFINKKLGGNISGDQIETILKNYAYTYTRTDDEFEITVPPMRLDLQIPEDMVEEIGRVIGYDSLPSVLPLIPSIGERETSAWDKIMLVKKHLMDQGYREVFTYAFTDKGDVEVLASASDKSFLRTNLTDGLKESITMNNRNAPLLGIDDVKIFKIGTVFSQDKETMHVAYGDKKNVQEITLDDYIKTNNISLREIDPIPTSGGVDRQTTDKKDTSHFKMWSLYPFISRDIAVWILNTTESTELAKIIKEEGGDLLATEPRLVDTYTKEGRTSYAYRFVFQSYERTLSDEEVNPIMERIYSKCKEKGWEVR